MRQELFKNSVEPPRCDPHVQRGGKQGHVGRRWERVRFHFTVIVADDGQEENEEEGGCKLQ